MKRSILSLLTAIATCGAIYAAQTLNNPLGADGCYIVKWDCATNSFASANDFEADETFTFAIDITGTQWVSWLAADSNRRLATNFGTTSSGNGIVRDADRLYHIQGNIWGKTLKLSQLGAVNLTIGQQQAIYSNLFGFDMNGAWWLEPSDDIVGNSNCFFRTAPYTGTRTCPDFTTADYAGNPYTWINQGGYAVPCAVSSPCYSTNTGGGTTGGGTTGGGGGTTIDSTLVPGNQVYRFQADMFQRGYYNRPYERYEAEPGWCSTNGQFLAASDDQRNLQSEASHQQAVQLNQVGDYVEWVVNKPGDGLTVRFSLPDGPQGQGTDGNLNVFAGEEQVGTLYLNSYWAWQYCDGTYPDNNPRTGNVVIRMRFDENHVRLSRPVAAGETLRLVKADKDGTPFTIDFAELEPVPAKVTFDQLSGNKVQFDGNGDVGQFIRSHAGQVIYLPEGTWTTDIRITMDNNSFDGTQVIGAGMWYTQIYFNASSDNQWVYNMRGFECYASNLRFEGLYLNTVNNKRYYNNQDSKQVGKGFMGSYGNNSVIRNCWVEHFECGAWFTNNNNGSNLLVEHCRFRNNYADGTNCSSGMRGTTIRYCSYRNNGDDDMASWSTSSRCENITYEYCTAENNWRASSLGFFGGKNLTGHHLYIADALESGVRVNADFSGAGFAQDGAVNIHDVTIDHTGCTSGTKGQRGDFWGNYQPALSIGAGGNYDIRNVHLENITIRNSRTVALNLRAASNRKIYDTSLRNIHVDGGTTAYQTSTGNNVINTTYCHLTSANVNTHMVGCSAWTQAGDCQGNDNPEEARANQSLPTVQPTEIEEAPAPFEARKVVRDGQLLLITPLGTYTAQGQLIH